MISVAAVPGGRQNEACSYYMQESNKMQFPNSQLSMLTISSTSGSQDRAGMADTPGRGRDDGTKALRQRHLSGICRGVSASIAVIQYIMFDMMC